MKLLYSFTIALFTCSLTSAQGVAINNTGTMPAAGAILDISSTSAGLLIPRMTEIQRDAITPNTQSMLIYQTDNDSGFYYYDGTSWAPFLIGGNAANSGWSTKGNMGTTPADNFIGTIDSVDWVLRTDSTEQMRVMANGNVGIGTTTPNNKVHLHEASSAFCNIQFSNSTTGTAAGCRLGIGSDEDFYMYNATTGEGLRLGTNNTTRLYIQSDGNVGIGTTTPDAKLTVIPNMRVGSLTLGTLTGSSGERANITYDAGVATYRVNGLNNVNMSIGAGATNDLLYVKAVNGRVGVGTTTPAQKLDVSGNIAVNGTTVHTSDRRFKQDINAIDNALEKIQHLAGVSYYFKKDEFKDKGFDNHQHFGVIAQDLEKVLPNLVYTNPDGYKGVNYIGITPVLIEAIKDLSVALEQQEQMVTELQEENHLLKSANSAILERLNEADSRIYQLEAIFNGISKR